MRMPQVAPFQDTPFFLDPGDPPSKRQILVAALDLFANKGLCETTVRDIANASGYTNPALFKFFPSKDALAAALFERCYLHLLDALTEAVSPNQSFPVNVRATVDTFMRVMTETPTVFLFVHDHLRQLLPRLSKKTRQRSLVGVFRNVVEWGIAEGSVPPHAQVTLVVAGIMGLLTQFARMSSFGEFSGAPDRWAPSLARTIHAIAAAT